MKNKYKITKEEHIWTSEHKLKFCGYGEWVKESDLLEFEYLGYQGCVRRVFVLEPFAKEETYFGGHLCGYVKIPDIHPYFKKENINIYCHGGITSNAVNEEHWIGFDCGHSGDYIPTMELFRKKRQEAGELESFSIPKEFENFIIFNPVYRKMKYCIEECIRMIDQLIDIAVTTSIKEGAKAIEEI